MTFSSLAGIKTALSPIFLVAANLLPLLGVLAWGWDVTSVVIFYWTENLIIGFYNLIKILSKGSGKALFMSVFFLAHYGGFCAGHGIFLVELFDLQSTMVPLPESNWFGPFAFLQLIWEAAHYILTISPTYWLWGFGAMFMSHGFSFLTNWLLGGERNATDVDQLMIEPYKRIFVMHIVIIFGGLGIQALGSPLPLLLLLIALKVAVDLRAHLQEHHLTWQDLVRFRQPTTASTNEV